jgi:hypothetical protein
MAARAGVGPASPAQMVTESVAPAIAALIILFLPLIL